MIGISPRALDQSIFARSLRPTSLNVRRSVVASMEMRETEITPFSTLGTEVAKSFHRADRRCHFASRVPVNKIQLDTALAVACKADLAERRAIGRAPAGPKLRYTPCKRSGACFPCG